ncbi:DUF2470 domain-containing protein [Motilibacter aurantiacus]|uniref:DUF2470 domain-containing protein n=1 Tax=Motilibacter aurantiacus TaxID=2714955 RepID=UPI002F2B747B
MSQASPNPFSDDVIAAVTRHMNEDHAEDSLLIVRHLGGQPDASAATMAGLDADQAVFTARVGGQEVGVAIPWSRQLTERRQVREEVVRMYEEACAAAGVEPRAH